MAANCRPDRLEIAYAGSKGTHLQGVTDPNQVLVPSSADVQRAGLTQLRLLHVNSESGQFHLHSLQLKAEKRLTHGLYVLAAFTWAKSINDLPRSAARPIPQNTTIWRPKRPLGFDQRRAWSPASTTNCRSQRAGLSDPRAADLLIGGWHLEAF